MWPFRRKQQEQRASYENPSVSLEDPVAWAELFEGDSVGTDETAGERVSRETALSVPAVWSAVQVLSTAIASLPLHVYGRDDEGGRELLKDKPVYRLLHRAPNPRMTSYRWRMHMMQSILLDGRSYSWIDKPEGGGIPRAIWPLDPTAVTIDWDSNRSEIIYRYHPEHGRARVFREPEIIDVPWMLKPDGVEHYSPVLKLRRAIGLSIALERYATRFFQGGGVPPLQLTGPIKSPGAAQRASEEVWQRILRRRNRNVITLPEGHELKQIGFNPDQSQFEEARRMQVEEVARVYDLPPSFLQDLSRSTFSNEEQKALHFVKHSLAKWTTSIEQEINLKLFGGNNKRWCEFSVDGLLRGDIEARMNAHSQAVQNSIRTPNEVRSLENLPPKEGGDSLMIQQNMSQLQQLGLDLEGGENDG